MFEYEMLYIYNIMKTLLSCMNFSEPIDFDLSIYNITAILNIMKSRFPKIKFSRL